MKNGEPMTEAEAIYIERKIQDSIPSKLNRTWKSYRNIFKQKIEEKSYGPAMPALYDYSGNCLICGETGRCPGYHISRSTWQRADKGEK